MSSKCVNLAIFASGSGTNAENIVRYFADNKEVSVKLILTNNPNAGVIERMKKYNISVRAFNREEFYQQNTILDLLLQSKIDYVILAGFLWLVPEKMIEVFDNKIINIHPALLPAYGGKGMYGHHVHQKVIENKETCSGITIHLVNKEYDKGTILFQAVCKIIEDDTADTLAQKIHSLEYQYFPQIILTKINTTK
ncbi:MAG TPA: phosphoribosylglycinamide formyltransferase [Bacteroidales bacterium]|jgi:phosphoribosylglycinamide formyltransferase-1|nr:phosphoribosylglycinamide formyltransferase [Bacteroidales bacterium]HOU97896.1 phosphoribosylglycinamide formyltransferase [Bacteroidales bacterium]